MQLFLSWSGERSKAVAELLDQWVKCVLQPVKPWISTHGIDRGAVWFNTISERLKTSVGIICLTQENKSEPWIHFEAGALAKAYPDSRVCTFLIDLKHTDVEQPLAQFNHTLPTVDGLLELMRTFNSLLPPDSMIDQMTLQKSFEAHWPSFEAAFEKIKKKYPGNVTSEPAKPEKLLTEILDSTRSLDRRLRNIEQQSTQPVSVFAPGSGSEVVTAGPIFSGSSGITAPSGYALTEGPQGNIVIIPVNKRQWPSGLPQPLSQAGISGTESSDGPKP